MFLRHVCNRDRSHQFFSYESDRISKKHPCPRPDCDGDLVRSSRAFKHRPKRHGVKSSERIDLPHIRAAVVTRPSRAAARKGEEERRKQMRDADLWASRVLDMLPDDGQDDFDLGDDDMLYVPGEPFKPSMRFTPSDGTRFDAGQRHFAIVAYNGLFTKVKSAPVRGSAVRKNANTVMGNSAHKWSGRGVEKAKGMAYRGDYEEWNHLIADCLGGPTTQDNLVSASSACNSYMLNIEACLRGKSGFTVEVKAYCSALHVAEWIVYKIIAGNGSSLLKEIDARNVYFTKDDGSELRREVMRFIKKNGG